MMLSDAPRVDMRVRLPPLFATAHTHSFLKTLSRFVPPSHSSYSFSVTNPHNTRHTPHILHQMSYAVFQAAEEAAAGGSRGRKRTADDTPKTGGWSHVCLGCVYRLECGLQCVMLA